jgi:hypothetical protein
MNIYHEEHEAHEVKKNKTVTGRENLNFFVAFVVKRFWSRLVLVTEERNG